MPSDALAEALAGPAGVESGGLFEVAERAQVDRDVYVILDQAEEYVHVPGDAAALRGDPRPSCLNG